MARSDWLGFHRVDNADKAWSRADLALGSTSNGSGVRARGQAITATGAGHRSTAARCYSELQREWGCEVAHHRRAETRRGRWRRLGVEARRGPAGIPRRSCCCGSGSSEKTNAAPAGHARKRAGIRRCTAMRGNDLRRREGQRLTGAREFDGRRRR